MREERDSTATTEGHQKEIAKHDRNRPTLIFWDLFQVDEQTDVVLLLLLWPIPNQPFPVFALQHVVNAVFDKIAPALNTHRENELGLCCRRGQVESDVVIVYKVDINASRPVR